MLRKQSILPSIGKGTPRQRGSTLLVVLVLLALLILLAATFSVSVRMELLASRNSAQAVAKANATRSALYEALSLLEGATSVTHALQPWYHVQTAKSVARQGTKTLANASKAATRGKEATRPYQLAVTDLSGKLNINAVREPTLFARFLLAVMPQEMANGVAERRAYALLQKRGPFVASQTTQCLDLRLPPPAGFHRIESLEELKATPEHPDLFTEAELKKLEPYLTVFSESPSSNNTSASSQPQEKVLLRESLRAETIYQELRTAYRGADDRLLRQYAVNLADVLDVDNIPSLMTDPRNPELWNALFGIELTPLIGEVYPDSLTKGVDDGQFVEISNPWSAPLHVDGWRLVVAGDGRTHLGTAMIPLSGTIAPGGYLVVTDRYETPAEGTEPGTGSFLAIFGRRADDGQHRVLESAALDLPDRNAYVTLLDPNGRVVDVFSYTDRAKRDSRESYQRPSPIIRAFIVTEATPLQPVGQGQSERLRAEVRDVEKLLGRSTEAPATLSAGDLFSIPSSYVGLQLAGTARRFAPKLAQLPATRLLLGKARGRDEAATNLDARLVDLFDSPATAFRGERYPESSVLHSFGKVNVNTCAPEVLWGLDGSADDVDLITPQFVEQFTQHRRNRYLSGQPPFASESDFVNFVSGVYNHNLSDSQKKALKKLLHQICVGSLSFEIWAQSTVGEAGSGRPANLPTMKAHWIVALDFQPCSIIHFAVNLW